MHKVTLLLGNLTLVFTCISLILLRVKTGLNYFPIRDSIKQNSCLLTIKHKEETRYCLRIVLALTIFRIYKLLGVQVHHPELRTEPTFGNVYPIVRHYTNAEASSHYQQP